MFIFNITSAFKIVVIFEIRERHFDSYSKRLLVCSEKWKVFKNKLAYASQKIGKIGSKHEKLQIM